MRGSLRKRPEQFALKLSGQTKMHPSAPKLPTQFSPARNQIPATKVGCAQLPRRIPRKKRETFQIRQLSRAANGALEPTSLLKINFKVNRCNVHSGKPTDERENRPQRLLKYTQPATVGSCSSTARLWLLRHLSVVANAPQHQSSRGIVPSYQVGWKYSVGILLQLLELTQMTFVPRQGGRGSCGVIHTLTITLAIKVAIRQHQDKPFRHKNPKPKLSFP